MARLPTKEQLGKPRDLVPSGGTPSIRVPDASSGAGAIGEGLSNLGRGLQSASASLHEAQEKDNALDAIRAEAYEKSEKMKLESSFSERMDYEKFGPEYEEKVKKIDEDSARLIRDSNLRERYVLEQGLRTQAGRGAITRLAQERKDHVDKVALLDSLEKHRVTYLDEKATPQQRAAALRDMDAAITLMERTGKITPEGAAALRQAKVKGSQKEWVEILRLRDPEDAAGRVVFAPKAAKVMQSLMDKYDLTKEQAAGIVGNFGHETGGFTHYKEIGSSENTGGRSWAQWTGPRRIAFLQYAQANGLDPRSDEAAWGFFQADPETPAAIEAVKQTKTADEAAVAFEGAFLRAGKKSWRSRLMYTRHALNAFVEGDELASMDPADRAEAEVKITNDLRDREKVGSVYEAEGWREDLKTQARVADPTDASDKTRVNVLTEEAPAELMRGNQDYFDKVVLPVTQETNMISGNVKGSFAAMLRSPDPSVRVFAMDNLDKLERASPSAFRRDMTEETVRFLARYRTQSQFDNPQAFATKMIEEESTPKKAEVRAALEADGKKAAEKAAPWATGYFYSEKLPVEASYFMGPEAPDGEDKKAFELDFTELYTQAYAEAGGDPKVALEETMAVMKKRWGVSKVSGEERLMRRPPEAYSPPDLDPSWMEVQARERLRPLVGDGPFKLVADDRTELELQSEGGTPTWQVFVPGGEGDGELNWSELVDPEDGSQIRLFLSPQLKAADMQWIMGGIGVSDEEAMDMAEDVGRSIPSYATTLGSSVLGLPGDIIKAGRWLGTVAGLNDPKNDKRIMGSAEVKEDLDKIVAPYLKDTTFAEGEGLYRPKTGLGQAVDLGAALLPAAFTGGVGSGGVLTKLGTRVMAPAGAASAVRELTEGTGWGPWAEAAALLIAPVAASRSVQALARGVQRRSAVPTTTELRTLEAAEYKAARLAEHTIDRTTYAQSVKNMLDEFQFQNPDMRKANPAVAGILSLMADAAVQQAPVTLRQLQIWRKMAGKIMDKPASDTMGQGALLYKTLNEFIDHLQKTPGAVKGPNAATAIQAWRNGDELHKRRKNSMVMDTVYKRARNRLANYSQAGEATGLRQKFRQIADKFADESSKEFKFFTPAMREAIEEVARGTPTLRAIRAIGSFVPWGLKGAATYVGPTATVALLGFGALVNKLAVGAALVTTGAKVADHFMTKSLAKKASDLVRAGKPLPAAKQPPYSTAVPGLGVPQVLDRDDKDGGQ